MGRIVFDMLQRDTLTVVESRIVLVGLTPNPIPPSGESPDLTEIEEAITELQGTLTTVQEEVTTVQGTLTTVQGTLTTVQEEVTTVQGTLTTVQEEVTTVQEDLITAQSSIEDISVTVNALNDLSILSNISGLTGAVQITKAVFMSQVDYDNREILPDDATTMFFVPEDSDYVIP
jgi:septation ring formation regulator EzrA